MAFNVKKSLLKASGLVKRGDLVGARALYKEVLEHFPANSAAKRGLADLNSPVGVNAVDRGPDERQVRHLIAAYNEGALSQARGPAERLAAAHPNDPLLQNLLGAIRAGLGLLEDAKEALQAAIKIKPDYAEAYENLASVYARLRMHGDAAECYESALQFGSKSAAAYANLYFEYLKLARWDWIPRQPVPASDAGLQGDDINPFKLLAVDGSSERSLRRARQYVRRNFARRPLGKIKPPASAPTKLRVGYFSADFHNHATLYLMIRLFELHNHERFEIFAYSFGPSDEGAMRERVKAAAVFRDVRQLSDKAIAELARNDEIHIAVDLKGFTENARTAVFAYRAAPIQINYLGYPGSMGADFIDYIIADEVVVPSDQHSMYNERVITLPSSYQVNDNTKAVATDAPDRDALGLPSDGFVFCCFNNTYKISPREFDVWMRLLRAIGGSVLWLLETNAEAKRNLRREAKKRGVEPDRLVFAVRTSLEEHLARHSQADLFLDTFTYNAHTTASDALWAGLPLITLAGEAFPSRVAASLLTAAGLGELICDSVEEYEALALEVANDAAMLRGIRDKLSKERFALPLFDTETFTRDIESAYEMVFERYLDGKAPISISL